MSGSKRVLSSQDRAGEPRTTSCRIFQVKGRKERIGILGGNVVVLPGSRNRKSHWAQCHSSFPEPPSVAEHHA